MQVIRYPDREDWKELLARPQMDLASLDKKTRKILEKVKSKGDKAIHKYNLKFDGFDQGGVEVSQEEIDEAVEMLPITLKEAIELAAKNIQSFHSFQVHQPDWVVTMPGIMCARKMVAIEKVGLYIPGGTAPLFSTVLMLGIPARIAGCTQVVLCSPPSREGKLHPAILFAAQLVGIKKIYKVGGAQAIAAMAYGTETIPRVDKIFGPGNQYVTYAKQLIQQEGVAIDLPAGPSEVCVLADNSANPAFVAADLLSQAEHGIDSQVLLVCTSVEIAEAVLEEIKNRLSDLPRREIAESAMKNSKLFLVHDLVEGIEMVNEYAPEHLILACSNEDLVADKIVNAGSVFLGNFSPESAGDYASGTNHTLPTNGYAKAYSGVSVDSFVKMITYQKLSPEGLRNISDAVIIMAEAEGLKAHADAVRIRIMKDSDEDNNV